MCPTFTKEDLVPAVKQVTAGESNTGFNMENINGILDQVLSVGEKVQRFQQVFGRPPVDKSELRNPMPQNTIGAVSPATNETLNREFNLKVQEIENKYKQQIEEIMKSKNITILVNTDKVDSIIDDLILRADSMPEFVKGMPISKGIEYLKSNKKVIKDTLIQKIPECIELKTE